MTADTKVQNLAVSYEARDGAIVKRIETPSGLRTSTRIRVDDAQDLSDAWAKSYLLGTELVRPEGIRGRVAVAELFCGSGGMAMGFGEACRELGLRFDSEACLDHDAEAVVVYASNHGSRVRSAKSASEIVDYQVVGDGQEAEFLYEPELIDPAWRKLIGQVDVLLAGPPCQGHSNLNNKTRRVDKRNQLYLTVPATAVALGVDVVVIENVEAVVHDRSRVVESACALLEKAGYVVEVGVISATGIGWPQTRRRYFMIARKSAAPIPVATVMNAFAAPSIRDVMWAIGDLADVPFDDKLHISTELSDENKKRINYLFDHDEYELPNSERPDCHKDGTTYGAVYGRMYPHKPAPTLTTGFLTPGRGRYIHPTQRRTITPREAARIQGYPDSYDFFPDPKNPTTKAKLTKWIGDAVPMPLGYIAGMCALAGDLSTFELP